MSENPEASFDPKGMELCEHSFMQVAADGMVFTSIYSLFYLMTGSLLRFLAIIFSVQHFFRYCYKVNLNIPPYY